MGTRLHLDPHDPLPLYAQLERAIKLAIATGTFPVGGQLPTVRQLAVDLSVNANTVAKVYAELERQGLVTTRRGVGTFVQAEPVTSTALPRAQRRIQLCRLAERFLAETISQGFDPQELLAQIQQLCSASQETFHGKH